MDWSTGCSGEGGSLKTEIQFKENKEKLLTTHNYQDFTGERKKLIKRDFMFIFGNL